VWPWQTALHNVFQRTFRFVFRRPNSFIYSGKEFGAFFNFLSIKPLAELGTLLWCQLLDRLSDFG
jgi:hypothetical protein